MNEIVEEKLKLLPDKPGVYLMKNEQGKIIYVGKAVVLKNRVRQYFQSSRNKGAKIEQMVTHITRFEYIVTDSEDVLTECLLNMLYEAGREGRIENSQGSKLPLICRMLYKLAGIPL